MIKRGYEILKITNGISTSNLEFEGAGTLLYLKVSDMNNPKNKPYILETVNRCNLINESQLSNILERDTVVFPKRGAAIFTNKVGIMGRRGTLDPNIIAVIPKVKDLHFKYLYYYLKYFNLSNICENAGLPQLNKKDLDPLKFIYPPLYEQQKIVSILENVDFLIQNTQRLIEKLQDCKKGQMQHIFTQGIGHTEFKETRLGKVPESWEAVQLNDIAFKFLGGGTPLTKVVEYWTGTIPWITSAALNKMYINEGMRYITKEGLNNSSSNLIPKDSLLISTRVGIGKVGIAGTDMAISQDLTGIIIDSNKVLIEYLYWVLINSKNELRNISQGTTVKGIERDSLKILRILLPSLLEQNQIVVIMKNIESQIENKILFITKLKKIKKGLMQDLLTGKKRVRLAN